MYIYKTTNLLNGKVYIGQSKFNPDQNKDYLGSGFILLRAITCYGKENFSKEILEECETREKLCERERFWISTFKSNMRGIGYNICEGGERGDNWTNHPNKEEWRRKLQGRSGKKNSNYGNRWTEEMRKSLSEKRKNNPTLIDKKTGINIAKLPEVRKNISDGKLGIKNPNGCIWKLISPIGEEFTIEGGIKREITKYGIGYQQFQLGFQIDKNTRRNRKGWTLIRINVHGSK